MKTTPLRVAPYTGMERDPGATAPASAAGRRRAGKTSTDARSKLNDPEARADAIARAAPFSARPRDVLLRLATAASIAGHRSGTTLLVGGQRCETITITVEGSVMASVLSPAGRRLIFNFDDAAYAYGLSPLVDGLVPPHDVMADGPVTVICMSFADIRGELERRPALWESIAVEVNRRGLGLNRQILQFVFDAPLVRAAALLLGMLAKSGKDGERGPVDIGFRLSQERLAELLGTSRQWATALVRDLSNAGIVEWRYAGVTVLDVQALRNLASTGIEATGQRSENLAGQWHVDPAKAPAAGAKRRAK